MHRDYSASPSSLPFLTSHTLLPFPALFSISPYIPLHSSSSTPRRRRRRSQRARHPQVRLPSVEPRPVADLRFPSIPHPPPHSTLLTALPVAVVIVDKQPTPIVSPSSSSHAPARSSRHHPRSVERPRFFGCPPTYKPGTLRFPYSSPSPSFRPPPSSLVHVAWSSPSTSSVEVGTSFVVVVVGGER
ncbi:hypothetical protein DFP72DRAFT_427516 [Ephemerocybe angulata]|uniref:Uncharacterized protein n=1 Tax=Ephemerocybe angulata TaxID=980116 RepID=A0A8H6HVQ6_9AGAR|nr:hypothetical protein DFP72DRAFT_427516 [Tulosesus angulatus]